MAAAVINKRTGIALFRVRDIEIRLDYSWFIVFILVLWSLSAGYFPQAYPDQPMSLYWMGGLLAAILFFLSVITHELSHSFMAIRSGIKIPEITLFYFWRHCAPVRGSRRSANRVQERYRRTYDESGFGSCFLARSKYFERRSTFYPH